MWFKQEPPKRSTYSSYLLFREKHSSLFSLSVIEVVYSIGYRKFKLKDYVFYLWFFCEKNSCFFCLNSFTRFPQLQWTKRRISCYKTFLSSKTTFSAISSLPVPVAGFKLSIFALWNKCPYHCAERAQPSTTFYQIDVHATIVRIWISQWFLAKKNIFIFQETFHKN